MIPINNLLRFYRSPPTGGDQGDVGALCHAAKLVDDGASKRYGYRFPVYISDKAYQRCVAFGLRCADKDDGKRLETLRIFKVLSRAKYAIRHAAPGSTMATMAVTLNEGKQASNVVELTVMVILLGKAAPGLLIRLSQEKHEEDPENLMSDWATGVSTIKEAV